MSFLGPSDACYTKRKRHVPRVAGLPSFSRKQEPELALGPESEATQRLGGKPDEDFGSLSLYQIWEQILTQVDNRMWSD
jgi:hypothetical protein